MEYGPLIKKTAGSKSDPQRNPLKTNPQMSSGQPRSYRILKIILLGLLAIFIFYQSGRYIWREYRWRWIVIHHQGSDTGDLASIQRYHREQRGWSDAAYHFVINNGSRGTVPGQIEESDRWKKRINAGSTKRGLVNRMSIAIVLVGNFQKHPPSPQQKEKLIKLLTRLSREYSIPPERIRGHGEVDNTECPGRYLDLNEIRSRVAHRLLQEE